MIALEKSSLKLLEVVVEIRTVDSWNFTKLQNKLKILIGTVVLPVLLSSYPRKEIHFLKYWYY